MRKNVKNENQLKENFLKEKDFYKTSDLALAAVISLFHQIEAIEKTRLGNKAYFVFKREEGLDELIEAYWKKELKIEPQTFFFQLKMLKARLYSEGQIN